MKKSVVLGTVLSLSLAIIVAVAAIAPTSANYIQSNSLVADYGSEGQVVLQLPSGVPSHPTTLMITVSDMDRRSEFGSHNLLSISLWIPQRNNLVSVAIISDCPDPDAPPYVKTVLAGTPVWKPPMYQNLFYVADEELEVKMRGDVLTANLTKSVHISLPFPAPIGDLSFDLPPMALEFRGFDDAFSDKETLVLPKPLFSGYTITTTSTNKPAWVSVSIPTWCGSSFKFVGTLTPQLVRTYTPPPP